MSRRNIGLNVLKAIENDAEFYSRAVRPLLGEGWKFIQSLAAELSVVESCREKLQPLGESEQPCVNYLEEAVNSIHNDLDSANKIIECLETPELFCSLSRRDCLQKVRDDLIGQLGWNSYERHRKNKAFRGHLVAVDLSLIHI